MPKLVNKLYKAIIELTTDTLIVSNPIPHSHTHIPHEGGCHTEVASNCCEVEWSHAGDKPLQPSVLHTVPNIGRVMFWLTLKSDT